MEWIGRRWPAIVIVVLYVVGTAGFLFPGARDGFASLTWITLLVSFVLLVYRHEHKTPGFFFSLFLIGALGYFAEVIGVKTGVLFGSYAYGPNLGWKLFGTPLMIAVNWAMLVYLSNFVARDFRLGPITTAAVAAGIMTALDTLIEPFAIRFDLWSWAGGPVPVKNYIMWFVLGFAFNVIYQLYNPKRGNSLARLLAACLLLFFLLIDWLVIWT